jgi:hypothetical protein
MDHNDPNYDIDQSIARHAMLHALAAAVLSRTEGTVLVQVAQTTADEWTRAEPKLQLNTLATLTGCPWWAASTASTPKDQALIRPRQSELSRELNKLPPLTPQANKVLATVLAAPSYDQMAQHTVGLVRAGTMNPPQVVSATFEAVVALIHVAATTHEYTSMGDLCILLAQMTLAVNDLLSY